MPLIFRDTKGSPLTSAEADANIRQLAISATYTAGSGVAISGANVISAASDKYFFKVDGGYTVYGGISDSIVLSNSASGNVGFQTVPLNVVKINVFPAGGVSGWDATNYQYVIQETGLYEIWGNFRLEDALSGGPTATPASKSYGVGLGTVNQDSSDFKWNQTFVNRNSSDKVVKGVFNAGDRIRMFVYLDGFAAGAGGMMGIRNL